MENLDLNIRNYDLEDITNLFRIPINFNKEDLKNAKKVVLKTHPDKSRLDKKYFLFFSKAYKVLYSIYEFKNKNEKNFDNELDTEYDKFIELELLNYFEAINEDEEQQEEEEEEDSGFVESKNGSTEPQALSKNAIKYLSYLN